MQFISKYVGIGLWVAQVQGMDLVVELLDMQRMHALWLSSKITEMAFIHNKA